MVGAAGLAPMAFGMMPAAADAMHASAIAGHTSGKPRGKTVQLAHRSAPNLECFTNNPEYGFGNGLDGFTSYNGSCVGFQSAWISHLQSGLTERVRFWKNHNIIVSKWDGGFFSGSKTRFLSSPYEHVSEVCEALVANGNHADVKYGPACERP
jgi:hypothetical protein